MGDERGEHRGDELSVMLQIFGEKKGREIEGCKSTHTHTRPSRRRRMKNHLSYLSELFLASYYSHIYIPEELSERRFYFGFISCQSRSCPVRPI